MAAKKAAKKTTKGDGKTTAKADQYAALAHGMTNTQVLELWKDILAPNHRV